MATPARTSEIVLKLRLTSEAQAALARRAAESGRDVADYAAGVLERAVAAPTLDEVLAPFRGQVTDAGMTDDQLDDFYEGLRGAAWQDQQRRRKE